MAMRFWSKTGQRNALAQNAARKGVLFQPGYIAAADAELCGALLLRLRDGAIQAVPQGQNPVSYTHLAPTNKIAAAVGE